MAEDIEPIADTLNAGEVVIRDVNTDGLTVNKAVAVLSTGGYQYANATGMANPAIGFVKVSSLTIGEIVTHGPMSGFTDLTPDAVYYLDTSDGEITLTRRPGHQVVGRALDDEILIVGIEAPVAPADCLSLSGRCDSGMVASTTDLYSAELAGFGDDYFNGKFYVLVVKNANSIGNTPEFQVRKVTDYVSATGKFVCDAFGANVEANDDIMLIHESIVAIGRNDADNVFDSSTVVPDDDGSVLERLEFLQATILDATRSGKPQISFKTIDLAQVAASYDLFTGTTQDVLIESLLIRLPNVDCSDDATITSISIQTDDVTAFVFINSTQGAKANLLPNAQLNWVGSVLLKVGSKIQLTINGGAADAATVCDVIAKCRSVVSGGHLV